MATNWSHQDAANISNAPVADAVPTRMETHQPRIISSEGIFDLDSLTDDDFRKIVFLLTPYLSNGDCSYVLSQNISPDKKMQYLLTQVRKQTSGDKALNYGLVVCELLYLIKQYRLLRLQPHLTRMCLHQAKMNFADGKSTNIVPKFWRFMFKLCESLDDAEVEFLSRYIGEDSGIKTAEDLMKHLLFRSRKISESNLNALEPAFEALGRQDLKKLIQGNRAYPMERIPGKHCGLAVIFNNNTFKKQAQHGTSSMENTNLWEEEREGTDVDAKDLRTLWEGFGLEVRMYTDTASYEMHSILDEISQNDFPLNVFVCCILTHGEKGSIFGSDRVPVSLESVYYKFGTSKKLESKPKLFFIQACQGTLQQEGLGRRVFQESRIQLDGPSGSASQPLYSDMLIGVSTIPWFVSYRSPTDGSLYIHHLVRTLEEHWETHDINEILTIVNHKVAKETVVQNRNVVPVHATMERVPVQAECKQMPTVQNQLLLKLYFKKEQQQTAN